MLCLCMALRPRALAKPCRGYTVLCLCRTTLCKTTLCRSHSILCPSPSQRLYALATPIGSMPMQFCANLRPSSSLQCLRLTLRCYALPLLSYAVLIQSPSVQCLSLAMMRNATLCPCSSVLRLCVAKLCPLPFLPFPCISKPRPSSQCLRRSRSRLTKQCRSAAASCETMP